MALELSEAHENKVPHIRTQNKNNQVSTLRVDTYNILLHQAGIEPALHRER